MLPLLANLSASVQLWVLVALMVQLAPPEPQVLAQLGPLEPKELPAFKAPLAQQAVRQMLHSYKV